MKKYILLSLCLMTLSSSFAQLKDFKFKFYGQIRTDFYYNSRANEETVDGLFYMYPKDELLDGNGEDLNATSNSNFYTLYSRLGLDVAGPKLGTAKTSAKVEVHQILQDLRKQKRTSAGRELLTPPFVCAMHTLIWTGESRLCW